MQATKMRQSEQIVPAQVLAGKVLEELLQQGPPADFSYSRRHYQL